ncbi:MAG: FkbM family methyltransferase [Promethearchaeota archaeon]
MRKNPLHILKKLIAKNYNIIRPFLSDQYRVYNYLGGKIYLNIKESPMMFKRALGVFETRKTETLCSFLKPGMTFVDIGANKGYFSLIAAKIVGEQGLVFTFEPEPQNCEWIQKNIELNNYKNITLFPYALGAKNGKTRLFIGKKSGWHSLLPDLDTGTGESIEIEQKTLDSVLKEMKHERVDMIKIDVEGSELEVLKGAQKILESNKNIFLLIDVHTTLGVSPEEVEKILKAYNFTIHELEPPYREIPKMNKATQEIFAKKIAD